MMTFTSLAPDIDSDHAPLPAYITSLSPFMRDSLIAHIEGPQPVRVATINHATVLALCRKNLLRFDRHKAPQYTMLTEKGRQAALICAAFEADRLMEAENAL